jgi:threonine aldolase
MRKMLGGAMRQAGLIAAGGLYALHNHLPLLKEDHRRARELALGLEGIPHLSLVKVELPTNMVYFYLDSKHNMSAKELKNKLKEREILIGFEGKNLVRLVTHLWISDKDIENVIQAFRDLLG